MTDIPTTALLLVAAVLLLTVPVLVDVLARGAIARIGLRNVVRRPGEAALVVAGALLATALIVAASVVGDSFGDSVREQSATELGPIDIVATAPGTGRSDVLGPVAAVPREAATAVDAVLSATEADVSVEGPSGSVRPRVRAWSVVPADARRFVVEGGGAPGSAPPSGLGARQVVLGAGLAEDIGAHPGSRVALAAAGQRAELTVATVLPDGGITGYAPVILGPDVLAAASRSEAGWTRQVVAVSARGGATAGPAVLATAEHAVARAAPDGTSVRGLKHEALARAAEVTRQTTTRFTTVGGFTVAAAVLLLVTLFVLLAVERARELGTMRALGMQQAALRRVLSVEGLVYSLTASILGALVGMLLAAGVIGVAGGALAHDTGVEIRLHVRAVSVLTGAAVGLVVSQAAIAATAWRVTRIDIVAALAGRTDTSPRHRRMPAWLPLLAAVAALLCLLAAPRNTWVLLVAPVILLLAPVPLVAARWGRSAAALPALAAIAWSISVFGIFPDVFERVPITIFVVQGLLMVGLAVGVLAVLAPSAVRAVTRVRPGSVRLRLGLSHAVDRPVRWWLLTTMFALVVFTLAFTSVLGTVLGLETPKDLARAGGDYGVVAVQPRTVGDAGAADPARVPGVATDLRWRDRSALVRSEELDDYDRRKNQADVPTGSGAGGATRREVTLVTPEVVRTPLQLAERDAGLGSDADAWRAVEADPSLTIVPKYVGLDVGDTVTLLDRSGREDSLRVVGLSDWNWLVGAGLYVSDRLAPAFLTDDQPVVRTFLTARAPLTSEALADRVNRELGVQGVDAFVVETAITEQNAPAIEFVGILQGYVAAGLVVGMAGLAVALVRSVRERQVVLGVLRAIGVPGRLLRGSLLVEAATSSVTGVALGLLLGVLSAWQTLIGSTAVARHLTFGVPWVLLIAIGAGAVVAAGVAALAPAAIVGRTSPAESIRAG